MIIFILQLLLAVNSLLSPSVAVSDFDWSVQVKVMDDPWSIGVGGCPDHNDFKSLWSDIPRVSKARTYQRKILFGDADTIIGGAFKPPKKNPSREEGDPFLKMKGSSKTKDDVAAKHNDSYPYPENTPPKNTRAVAHRYPGEETDNEYKAPLFSKAQNCLHESQPMRSRIPNLVPRSQDYPSEGLQMLKNNSKVLTKFPTPTPPIRSYIQNYEFDSHNGEEPVKEFDAPALMRLLISPSVDNCLFDSCSFFFLSSRSVKNEPSEHSDQNNDLLAEAADEILKVEAQNKKLLEQVSRLRMDISRAEVNKDSLRRRLFFTSVALISFIIILAVLLFC